MKDEALRRIKVLDKLVIKQIAAGEVIDRPSAALRELIDNSIDSGATKIDIVAQSGGIDLLQISDNGHGIHKDDLALTCISHATSKITQSSDLFTIQSMGFRGEALASLSSIASTTILSATEDEDAFEITVDGDSVSDIKPASRKRGTTIRARNLFHHVPARKKFLSQSKTEDTLLKTCMLKKAVAFPHIAFSLSLDKKETLYVPIESQFHRCVRICSNTNPSNYLWQEMVQKDGMSLQCTLGLPDIAQRSRKNIHLYINKRPIKDFSLSQATEYAYRNSIHGGLFPQAVLLIDIPPDKIDVNIHPTKAEVKILEQKQLRALIMSSIEKKLQEISAKSPVIYEKHIEGSLPEADYKPVAPAASITKKIQDAASAAGAASVAGNTMGDAAGAAGAAQYPHKEDSEDRATRPSSFLHDRNLHDRKGRSQKAPIKNTRSLLHQEISHEALETIRTRTAQQGYTYVGTVFETYLVFEKTSALYFLDFHAAHERILFDSLQSNTRQQDLLVPIPLNISSSSSNNKKLIEDYKKSNIIIKEKNNELLLCAVPEKCPVHSDKIAQIIEESSGSEAMNAALFARKACRYAVKAGDFVDVQRAFELFFTVQKLESPRCPHGRPLWIQMERKTLDSLIQRI